MKKKRTKKKKQEDNLKASTNTPSLFPCDIDIFAVSLCLPDCDCTCMNTCMRAQAGGQTTRNQKEKKKNDDNGDNADDVDYEEWQREEQENAAQKKTKKAKGKKDKKERKKEEEREACGWVTHENRRKTNTTRATTKSLPFIAPHQHQRPRKRRRQPRRQRCERPCCSRA